MTKCDVCGKVARSGEVVFMVNGRDFPASCVQALGNEVYANALKYTDRRTA